MTTTRLLQQLQDLAASLRPRFTPEKPLPRLLFVTDPRRTPDPESIAAALPAGSGVIYRAFGADDALARARRLKAIAVERGLILLIGADAALAAACAAHGVHLPEARIDQAPALRGAHPDWILTAAAHSLTAAEEAAGASCDAALVSTVFASDSPSAGAPMRAAAFAALVQAAPLPVYALGGVTIRTAPDLSGSGAQGFAMVEGMVEAVRT
ncbi:MAG: thiamine phosphate synthase [Caulobacterales bacterium]|nr:thiamine phosphate synthase [Caulobacterales bacterium]